MQTVHEESHLHKNSSNTSVSLNHDKEAAASNSLPSSSSKLDFTGRRKQSQQKNSWCQWDFPTLLSAQQSYKVILCTLEHYGLDCSFTEEQLIHGG